jgi:phosphoribosylaminoimidazole carboxylase (NCAIR synthetase)
MLKWSRFGYDGKGNLPFRPSNDASMAENFLQEGLKRGAQIYAEEWIRFDQELALVTAVNTNAEIRFFPLVISEQRDSICFKVRGPAQNFGVSQLVVDQACEIAEKVALELGFVGCFALEFFFSEEWGLKINEMAPRVHNTGHHTQLSSNQNQFDLHLLAISGLPLPQLTSKPVFAMINILGEWPRIELTSGPGAIQIYSYDKEPRPKRKLGHINLVAANSKELEKNLTLVESWIP